MSKLTDELRKFGFHNSACFSSARGVLNGNYPFDRPAPRCRIYREHRIVPSIWYAPAQAGRGYKAACWNVSQGNVPTNPDAHYRDYGRKTFSVHGRDEKQPKFEEALAWASEYFGVTEWKREPWGSWMPSEFVDWRLAQLKEWLKEMQAAAE